nr:MAG TPA: hypothetical protein [Caudoviricetes sp.]
MINIDISVSFYLTKIHFFFKPAICFSTILL